MNKWFNIVSRLKRWLYKQRLEKAYCRANSICDLENDVVAIEQWPIW